MIDATTITDATPAQKLEAAAAALGITMRATFVPFSQSRNAKPGGFGGDKPFRSLNWRVTLERNSRPFLETDYSQGIGHAPAGMASIATHGGPNSLMRESALTIEIEQGRVAMPHGAGGGFYAGKAIAPPPLADVLHSLVSDCSVLDAGCFEQWADDYGYSTDSRAAEATYRACLEIALKMRGAIGDAGLEALRAAGEEF